MLNIDPLCPEASHLPARPAPAPPSSILGLDGLRAFSVLAVLLFHAQYGWMRGGYLGVEVFFVISGFLITTLLLREVLAQGRIELGAFWNKRMRRLLPALCAVLFGLAAFGCYLGPMASQFRADLAASFFYLENWHQIHSQNSYFADQGLPLLRHLWSLSVEGQFYFAWPFLIWAATRWGKGRIWPLAVMTLALAMGSLALGLGLADPGNASAVAASASLNRVYLGTDTRAFGLLAGALLALALHAPAPRPALARAVDAGSFAALAALALIMTRLEVQAPFLYRGGFLVVDLLTVAVIAALVLPARSWMGACLGWAPLEWLGRRSYGIYLWHWPVYRLLAPGRAGLPWLGLRLLVTMLLTEATFRFLETPIRRGGLKRLFTLPEGTAASWRWRLSRVSILVVAAAAVGGEASVLARRPAYVDPIQESIRAGAAALEDLRQAPAPPAAGLRPAAPAPARGVPWEPGPPIVLPEALQGVRVTAIGDSVMKGGALALKRMGEQCLGAGNIQIDAEECRAFGNAAEILRTCKKEQRLGDIVIIHLGTNNSSLPEDQFRRLMGVLLDTRMVLFLTVKSDKPQACEAVNRSLGALVAGFPNARLLDWNAVSEAHPECFYSDNTHLRPEGAQFYAATILEQVAIPMAVPATQAKGPFTAGKAPA